ATDDHLSGGNGDDRLIDFAGADTLTGGAGADTFVLVADDSDDHISDFEVGVDLIDVSAWGRIYDLRSLTVTETDQGATISYGQNKLTVNTADGQAIDPEELSNDDFLFI
ncbi:MAG: calcium-binding protein, partial [Sulfitobacter sp.]